MQDHDSVAFTQCSSHTIDLFQSICLSATQRPLIFHLDLRLHAVLHLGLRVQLLPRSDSPSHISVRQPVPAHFASLWFALIALHPVQPMYSGSILLCNTCTWASCWPPASLLQYLRPALHSPMFSVKPTQKTTPSTVRIIFFFFF